MLGGECVMKKRAAIVVLLVLLGCLLVVVAKADRTCDPESPSPPCLLERIKYLEEQVYRLRANVYLLGSCVRYNQDECGPDSDPGCVPSEWCELGLLDPDPCSEDDCGGKE
jgi:hypothetical protein